MQRFVARQNILHFKEMLAAEADPARRVLLAGMIADEEAKLTSADDGLAQVRQDGGPPGQPSAEVDHAQQQADPTGSPKR